MKPGTFKKVINKKKSVISRSPITGKLKKVKELSILEQQKITAKRDKDRTKRQIEIVEEKLDNLLGADFRERGRNIITTKNGRYKVEDKLYYSALLETYRSYLKISNKLAKDLKKSDVVNIKLLLIKHIENMHKWCVMWQHET